jgi:hypothetical protein
MFSFPPSKKEEEEKEEKEVTSVCHKSHHLFL